MNAMSNSPKPNTSQAQHVDTYDAREIVKDGVQARILLDEQTYYLSITRAGKLILTK